MDESSSDYIPKVLSVLTIVLTFVLNIAVAIIINMDKSKLGIEGKYSVLLTIFYRPIGVVVFLIYLINKEFSRKASLWYMGQAYWYTAMIKGNTNVETTFKIHK